MFAIGPVYYGYKLATENSGAKMCWNSDYGCTNLQIGSMIFVALFLTCALISVALSNKK